MGEKLMANSSKLLSKNRTMKMKEQRVERFFEEFHAMRTMKNAHPFFEKMIQALIVGENRKEEKRRHNEGKLAVLTVHDGHYLGASFLKFLSFAATEEGAFASWAKKYPAMNELSAKYKFFKPLMLKIGKEIRHSATWYKFALSAGASMASMLDVASDIYTISIYRSRGLFETADLMTTFVALSIGLQILFVGEWRAPSGATTTTNPSLSPLCCKVAIHHQDKKRALIELLGTVTFTKQGLSYWRCLTNVKMTNDDIMPPVSEMMMFQMCEVFAECIPMAVIQITNVLEMARKDYVLVAALGISVAFVAEAVSYMTYLKDIDEESRRTGKIFYGFIPLQGVRLSLVTVSMRLLSFCQLLGKSFEMAILVQVGGKTLAISVLGGEMVAYLIYKVVRGDFRYWMPMPRGTSLATSLIMRVTVKVICDFTGFLHARHPYEMGGLYWLMNMVFTQVSVFGAIKLKEEYGWSEEVEGRVIEDEYYTTIAIWLFAVWFVSLLVLLLSSEQELVFTFMSARTGKQYNRAIFNSGVDEVMMQVFTDHPSYYSSYEDEITKWLGENWNAWNEARPGWLSDAVIDTVPLRLLPGVEEGEEGVLGLVSSRQISTKLSSFLL